MPIARVESRASILNLAGAAGVAVALFVLALAVSIAAVGGVDVTAAGLLLGAPALAAAAAILVARLLSLDERVARLVGRSAWEPAQTVEAVVASAEQVHLHGRASLVGSQPDGLLADGLRLVRAGADARLIRSVLEHRLDRSIARGAHWLHLLAVVARLGPVAAVPFVAAVALVLLERAGTAGAWPPSLIAGVAASLVLLPVLVLIGPAREEVWRRIAARALAGTLVIEGVVAIRDGENPRAIEARLLALLPPATTAAAAPAAA